MKHAGRKAPTPSSSSRGKRRGRAPRRHTVAKVLTSSLLALALVTGLGVTWLYSHLNGNLDRESVSAQLKNRPVDTGPKGALNILVMGSDTREGKGNKIDAEQGAGGGSDTTILMHLSADRKSAYGISIPRDTIVDRPECTAKNGDTIPAAEGVMWNAAYNVGGQACTIQQFEQLTGVRVDNYVVVDFSGFKSMVDAVGGVDICVPKEIDDSYTGLKLQPGNQTVSGNEALSYVRLRHGVGDGSDIGRIKRQQAFIAAMANKVVSGKTLANPGRILGFLDAATKSLKVDASTNLLDLAKVGNQFKGVGLSRIQFITVPFSYFPVGSANSGRVYMTDDADALWTKVTKDAPLGSFRSGAINASSKPTAPTSSGPSDDPSASPSDEPTDDATDEPTSPTESPSPTRGLDDEELAQVGLCS